MSFKAYRSNRVRNRRPSSEQLEVRVVLDCSGILTGEIEFDESEWVRNNEEGTLGFVSLRVGAVPSSGDPFDSEVVSDDTIVTVRDHDLTMGQVKAYLHGFADFIGTDLIIETQDFRVSSWGTGSGSTSAQFDDYIEDQIANREPCTGLRFSEAVTFNLPGTGGELFTGGFLELPKEGLGTLLRGGDIAELVESYQISSEGAKTTLTVDAQLGEMKFTINADQTLTDEFDRIWSPDAEFEIIDPNATDELLGDFDGNGAVDFTDFLFFSDNFGSDNAKADLDGSGTVDFTDFLLFADNFGSE